MADTVAVNPQMVTLARESRDLTQTGLAKAMDVAQGTVSKVENAQLQPTADFVQRMSDVLDYPPELFSDPLVYRNLPVTFYRKRASVRVGAIRAIRAKLNLLRQQIEKLVRSVDLPELRVPFVNLADRKQSIERAAAELRIKWHLPRGPVKNLVQILEEAGVIVVRCLFGTAGVDAISVYEPQDNLPPMIFIADGVPGDRLRFSIAHELGHLVAHHHLPMPTPESEAEANRFASEFLMPAFDIRGHLPRRLTLEKLAGLKPHWRVSMAALLERAFQLHCISERQRRSGWAQLSARGYNQVEPFPIAAEQPTLINEIVQVHLDSLGYTEQELSALVRLRPAEFRELYMAKGPTLRVVRSGVSVPPARLRI